MHQLCSLEKFIKNICIYFYDMQAPGLHIIQYWNIYKIVVIAVKNKKMTFYIEDLVHHMAGKMTHKENLDDAESKPLLRAPPMI